MSPLRRLPLALLAALAVACARGGGEGPAAAEIATDEGITRLAVEIADSPDERRRGLMGRRSLAPDEGMAFLYPEDHRAAFWMKDTSIPLSIAFFDADGRILRILDMAPCRRDPCPLYRAGVPYRGALEVRRGGFDRWGVEPGDVISIDR